MVAGDRAADGATEYGCGSNVDPRRGLRRPRAATCGAIRLTTPIRFHEGAHADLIGAWDWYEGQQPGLGDRLAAAVDRALDQIAEWPASGSPTPDRSERRIVVAGFPYAIRYRVRADHLLVTAVYHQHRHPDFGAGQ